MMAQADFRRQATASLSVAVVDNRISVSFAA